MSTAHRPTWDPAQGRSTNINTRQYSSRDMASHTKLKFRQVGQSSAGEVKKRDLLKELKEAEEQVARKRGRPIEVTSGEDVKMIEDVRGEEEEEDERRKRRKVLEAALEEDKDSSDEEEEVYVLSSDDVCSTLSHSSHLITTGLSLNRKARHALYHRL
jgi:protein CWC15